MAGHTSLGDGARNRHTLLDWQSALFFEDADLGLVSDRSSMRKTGRCCSPSRGLKGRLCTSPCGPLPAKADHSSLCHIPRQRREGDQGRLHVSCCGSGPAPSPLAGTPQAAGGDLAGLSLLRVDSAGQLRADCALLQWMTHSRQHLPLRGQPAQLQRG